MYTLIIQLFGDATDKFITIKKYLSIEDLNLGFFALGIYPRPEDIMDFLCPPKSDEIPTDAAESRRVLDRFRHQQAEFNKMVEEIRGLKEAMERKRQSEERRRT